MKTTTNPSMTTAEAWDTLKNTVVTDPDYAWAFHCNLAVPLMDATGISHFNANRSASLIMCQLFGVDMTANPGYPVAYGKTVAQQMYERRILAETEEDNERQVSERDPAGTLEEIIQRELHASQTAQPGPTPGTDTGRGDTRAVEEPQPPPGSE